MHKGSAIDYSDKVNIDNFPALRKLVSAIQEREELKGELASYVAQQHYLEEQKKQCKIGEKLQLFLPYRT